MEARKCQESEEGVSSPAKAFTRDEIKTLIEQNIQINRGIKEISEKVQVYLI